MSETSATTDTGRSPAKRRAILQAASKVFVREGYKGASVDSIAAAAGVAKQTVYGHFGNKEQLFLAVVEQARNSGGIGPERLATLIADTGDARTDLEAAGERLLRAITSPEQAALHRLTIAEAPLHPELQRSWRDDGATPAIAVVAAYLTACVARGELSMPDPARAARQFTILLSAEGQVRSLRGLQQLTDSELRDIARDTTDLIIRAYRP
ncbi:TetR/AcrR family transcriptional regulator [Streptomyces sp. NPDC059752]|uniref:TetR/AcrR family transcriptional regulator n=1 Tax=unclassified Streptomyces TaxID=2593676 RepID=UPI003654C8B3